MSVLNHLGQAAATLLLLELMVVLLLFLGISGGLAWGLHWVAGKTDWAFGKVNDYVRLGQKYAHTATGYAAKPFIVISGVSENFKGTARGLKTAVQRSRLGAETPAARPVAPTAIPPERIAYVQESTVATTAQTLAPVAHAERQ